MRELLALAYLEKIKEVCQLSKTDPLKAIAAVKAIEALVLEFEQFSKSQTPEKL